eukprot:NODE_1317_length_627_cov_630.960208_g1035_i0.p1 GENE.NODE_1317_length_627_cov_630.960208_g1035_i0~~NODE_1317_length_627_cov_630.960208_g1035_i0.p1  ORF type:complete len:161 (-),score=16.67 NODE_1317_length_627_cov_630.960208_g1035_i0:145-597(-)
MGVMSSVLGSHHPSYSQRQHQVMSMFTCSQTEPGDVESLSLPLPLVCPLSKTRMRIPAKGIKCRHIACFDLSNFVITSCRRERRKPGVMPGCWPCPLCAATIKPTTVFIDAFVLHVVQSAPLCEELVQVFPDGSWHCSTMRYTHISSAAP